MKTKFQKKSASKLAKVEALSSKQLQAVTGGKADAKKALDAFVKVTGNA